MENTRQLLRDTNELLNDVLRRTRTEATVPHPKSLSAFLANYSKPGVRTTTMEDRIAAIKKKAWAAALSEEQLMRIAGEQPRLSHGNDPASSFPRIVDGQGDRRRRWAGIVPKHLKPAIERLNDGLLKERLQAQQGPVTVRKATEKWRGIRVRDEERVDEAVSDECLEGEGGRERERERKCECDDAVESEAEHRGLEQTNDEEKEAPGKRLTILSSDEEDSVDSMVALSNAEHKQDMGQLGHASTVHACDEGRVDGRTVQTDISLFFSGMPDKDIKKHIREQMNARKRTKKAERLRRAFLDEEAEESSEHSSDDDRPSDASKRTRKRPQDDEHVDEEAIRRELVASRFIADDAIADTELESRNVYNRLELNRDKGEVQAIIDRFARDKLSTHLNTTIGGPGRHKNHKHAPNAEEEEEEGNDVVFAGLVGSESDGIDELIRADSEGSEYLSDYDGSSSSDDDAMTASIIQGLWDNIQVSEPVQRHNRLTMNAALLSRLEPSEQGNTTVSQPKTGGFTVGRSLPFSRRE